jgi:two-component system, OmpR family, response regulator ResD
VNVMDQHTLLIATTHQGRRAFLAGQLDADGHTVHEADHLAAAVAKLSAHAIDVVLLGGLEHPVEGRTLLRAVRGGEHPRIHPGQPIITLGAGDELAALRAYESGSDHHLAEETGYVLVRTVIASVMRRVDEHNGGRHLQVADIHIDLAARTVNVAGVAVHVSRLEFELLVKFASDPTRVVSKHELARCIWHRQHVNSRTIDSHIARLRGRLTDAGADRVLVNKWGQGWSLTAPVAKPVGQRNAHPA